MYSIMPKSMWQFSCLFAAHWRNISIVFGNLEGFSIPTESGAGDRRIPVLLPLHTSFFEFRDMVE